MMKNFTFLLIILAFLATTMTSNLFAQVSIDEDDYTFSQDFTGFLGSADPTNWLTSNAGGGDLSLWLGTGTGTGTAGGKYSYGTGSGASFEGSLGFLPSGNRAINADISFENNSGDIIEELTVSYVAEHWRSSLGGRLNGWAVSYSVDAGPFIPMASLTYVAPNNLPTGAGPHGSESLSQTITGLSISEGATITIRFFGDNGSLTGSRQGVAIDNFVFNTKNSTALPIDLLSFNATPKSGKVILDWTYENAIDFERFVVEHSAGDRGWSEIASVDLLEETISSRGNALNAVHDAPVKGANYYRLKMVDLDGTFKYSKVAAVNMDMKGSVRVVNNVVEDRVALRNEGGFDDITVRITDMQGRQVSEQVLRNVSGANEIFVEVDGVQGMFIMTVEAGGNVEAFRMMRR